MVLLYFQNLTHSYRLPGFRLELACLQISNKDLSFILFSVTPRALYIFIEIFDHRDDNDEGKREESGGLAIRNGDIWNALKNRHNQKVHIGHFRELECNVIEDEIVPSVFRRLNLVILERLVGQVVQLVGVSINFDLSGLLLLHNGVAAFCSFLPLYFHEGRLVSVNRLSLLVLPQKHL